MKFSISIGKDESAPIMGSAIQASVIRPQHAEMLRMAGERVKRMYDAATTTRFNVDQGVSITSANAEILVSISAARSRARKAERDNPYAASILKLAQNNIGGHDPFRYESKVGKWSADGKTFTEDTLTNRKLQDWWKKIGKPKNCTVGRTLSRNEVYWQAISAVVRDGGILARHYPGFQKNPFAYALEPIEIDRLDHYWNRPATGNANEIQFSIEMDQFHGPLAYWVLTRHPGDVYAWSNSPKYRERIDEDKIIALWDIRTRAGQYIGFPALAPVIQRLHRIDQFDIAHVTAAIWASCKPFFITRNKATAANYQGESQSSEGTKVTSNEPATGEILPDGYGVELVDPKFPIEASESFKKEQLRAVAAGSGSAYHMIANDLEGVNFSSGRLGLEQYHDECKKLQEHVIANFVEPHFCEALKWSMISGALDVPFSRYEEICDAAVFHGRRWPYVNPLQDAQADVLRIEAGLTSRDIVIADSEGGGDVEGVNASIANGRKSDEAHGLDFTSDPTLPTNKKGQVGEELPSPAAAETAPTKKGSKNVGRKKSIKGIDWERVDRTLKTLEQTDPGHKRNGNGVHVE